MDQRTDVAVPRAGAALRSARTEFFWGLRLLGRGFAAYGRSPRFLFLGMIPAVISFAVLAAGWVLLLYFLDDLAAQLTWFADGWSSAVRGPVRFIAGLGVVLVAALVSITVYTALTMLIGDPFYEVISQKLEERLGGTPGEAEEPWYRTIGKNAIDSIRLIAFSIAVAIPLFLLGFIPVVGQTVVPVLDAVIGGWLLAVEMTGVPFNRRGLRLRDRRKLLRANKAMALGFGIPVFLVLLIPFAAIVVVPAAVTAGTLLSRRLLGLSTELPGKGDARM